MLSPGQADIRLHHLHLIWHLRLSLPWPGSANIAQVPGTRGLVSLLSWPLCLSSQAPPDKPGLTLASQSCSVKMSQNMTSGCTIQISLSYFPFTLIPPFTQHVILLRKHLFSPLPLMPLLLAFLSFSLRLSEFSARWRSSELRLTAGAAHAGLNRNGQWGNALEPRQKKRNEEKCSKADLRICDLFYLGGLYCAVLSTQAIA